MSQKKNNPFQRVDVAKSSIKKQQIVDGHVVRKKRGRPRRPNMVKKLIKVDRVLYDRLSACAKSEHTTIASLLSQGIRKVLDAHQ